ncbi:PcfB family protein [Anaerobutyricum hallii]|uniref:PcfB family protein n=1 Tax=Anaerobutyricum hallii TaxID=39488 RepID=UPI003521A516
MQDEVNEKTVSLCIRGGKITAQLLKAAMRKALAQMEQEKAKQKQQSKVQKQQDDKTKDKSYRGKQTMEKLMRQNVQLSNIEITDGNIKSFERVAKKYSIDFSLKKDVTADPPRYYVFFKARDADVMTAAFKEYTGQTLNKDKKSSVRKKLQQAITKSLAKHRELEKTKGKEKEPSL